MVFYIWILSVSCQLWLIDDFGKKNKMQIRIRFFWKSGRSLLTGCLETKRENCCGGVYICAKTINSTVFGTEWDVRKWRHMSQVIGNEAWKLALLFMLYCMTNQRKILDLYLILDRASSNDVTRNLLIGGLLFILIPCFYFGHLSLNQ